MKEHPTLGEISLMLSFVTEDTSEGTSNVGRDQLDVVVLQRILVKEHPTLGEISLMLSFVTEDTSEGTSNVGRDQLDVVVCYRGY